MCSFFHRRGNCIIHAGVDRRAEKIDANEFFTSSTFFVPFSSPASNNFTSKQLGNVFALQRKFLINESGAELLCKYSLMNDGALAAEWVGVIKIEQFPR